MEVNKIIIKPTKRVSVSINEDLDREFRNLAFKLMDSDYAYYSKTLSLAMMEFIEEHKDYEF